MTDIGINTRWQTEINRLTYGQTHTDRQKTNDWYRDKHTVTDRKQLADIHWYRLNVRHKAGTAEEYRFPHTTRSGCPGLGTVQWNSTKAAYRQTHVAVHCLQMTSSGFQAVIQWNITKTGYRSTDVELSTVYVTSPGSLESLQINY